MQRAPVLSCWQCGTVLSAVGGRCPSCGAEQPAAPAPTTAAPLGAVPQAAFPRISRQRPPAPPAPGQKALPWVVLGVGLCAIGGIYAVLAPRHSDADAAVASTHPRPAPAASEARPADPNDFGVGNPSSVDPTEILPKAKTRALHWSKEAQMVSLRADPVAGGRVNLTSGGTIEFWFARPTGEGFGSGAKIAGKRLHIKLVDSGTQVEESPGGPGRAALEPNCPFDEAVRKVIASGVPATSTLTVSYELSDKYQKPVWRASSSGGGSVSRTVDGWTCAILVR